MLYYNLLAAGIYKIFAVPQIASGFSFGYRRRAVFPAFRYMHDCYRVSIAKFKIFDKPVMHFRFNVGKCSKIFQCAVRKIKIPLCIPAVLFVFRTAAGNEKRYFRCQIFASPLRKPKVHRAIVNSKSVFGKSNIMTAGNIMAAGNCRIV